MTEGKSVLLNELEDVLYTWLYTQPESESYRNTQTLNVVLSQISVCDTVKYSVTEAHIEKSHKVRITDSIKQVIRQYLQLT